jgi:NADPH:quinone reductase-like Zn-dependent oxidoreductase
MGSDRGAPLQATAYWTMAPGVGALREESLPEPGADDALVKTVHSGISRGTELLVHTGRVPERVAERMRAPFQDGDFPGPVKYGYLSVGKVEAGPDELVGREVFCLFPHQDRYVVPAAALTPLPDGVPARRATLAGAVETAVNALWDAAPRVGDRVAVVGGGLIGCAIAGLLCRFPLQRLQLVDVDPSRDAVAMRFGIELVDPATAADNCDVVFHASASSTGLQRSVELLGDEGEVIELSWYGSDVVVLELGADFHARRLGIRASQVGDVAPSRRVRRSLPERRALAMEMLRDDAFDVLITGSSPFADLPATMQRLASGELPALCHVVDY